MSTTTAAPLDGSCHLAIDLGAGSGRAVLGRVGRDGLFLDEVHRFHYPPATAAGRLRWPFGTILDGLKEGLAAGRRAATERGASIATVGVDSWGVDYGLLDAGGRLLEDPVCYRDHRTDGAMERVLRKVPRQEIFHRTGIQFLQFNTLFQLYVHVRDGLPAGARRLLMIPDLCHQALCGSTSGEHTNASTRSRGRLSSPAGRSCPREPGLSSGSSGPRPSCPTRRLAPTSRTRGAPSEPFAS
jgi:rhamnulokinase